VKSNARILSALFLTAVYCFAMVVVTGSYAHPANPHQPISSKKKLIAEFSTKQLWHTTPSESSVNYVNNLPSPNSKNPCAEPWAVVNATERLFETAFAQYTSCSGKTLINHRKSDIIFPHHYFW
jgi:hypothetical protein